MSKRVIKVGAGESTDMNFVNLKELYETLESSGAVGSEVDFEGTELKNIVAVGIYQGEMPPAKAGFKPSFKIESDEGLKVINSCGTLAKRLAEVEIGTYCAIQYNGKKIISSGDWKGTPAHQFEVYAVEE